VTESLDTGLFFLQSGLHFGGKVKCLGSWDSWPNGIRWIFGRRRKIAEGLAVIKPGLFLLRCGMGEIDGHVLIRLIEEGVPLGAEFLEGLGIDEFLEFCFELLFWGFWLPT